MILAVAAAVGGMALSYQQTIQEGKDAAELAKIQQQQLDAQAKSVDEAGQFESREKRKEGKRAIASQIAQMSANGGQITGSNLAIVANTAKVFEGDALVTARNYGMRAMELRNKGELVNWQGQLAKRNARIRATAGLFSGAAMMGMMSGIGGGGGSISGFSGKTSVSAPAFKRFTGGNVRNF